MSVTIDDLRLFLRDYGNLRKADRRVKVFCGFLWLCYCVHIHSVWQVAIRSALEG